MRALALACLVFSAVGCKPAAHRPPPVKPQPTGPQELVQIAELEDRRSLGDGQLTQWALTHADPVIRARAFLALARIQDPATLDTILKGLSDPEPFPRFEAAFAAGMLGLSWSKLPDGVLATLTEKVKEAESAEADPSVKLALLEALGRIATPLAIERLVERLSGQTDAVHARAALSLGIAVKREGEKAFPAKAVTLLVPLIKRESPVEVRYGGAYALAMSRSREARQFLLLCAQDDASEIRALCARALGDVGQDADAVTLKKLLDDADYRVVVEATRSLAKLAGRCKGAACPAIGALADLEFRVERVARGDSAGGGQPLLALAQQGLPPAGKPLLVKVRNAIVQSVRGVTDPRIRADLAKLDCRFAAAIDRVNGNLAESLNCGGGLVPEHERLRTALNELAAELAKSPPKDGARVVEQLGSFVYHDNKAVKVAALNLLGELRSSAALERVRANLTNEDLIVATAAAGAAAKLDDKASIPAIRALAAKAMPYGDVAPAVAEALARLGAKEAEPDLRAWLASTHANVRHSAADALSRITGQPVSAQRVERPVDKVKPPYLPKDAQLHFKTEKGDFTVKLYTADAPLTSLNLYTLAKKGFFRNLTFHRVVPNFVAQGGDPRGDGEGGPGYTIRCEINHKPYARGVVGMALSGKDTGGSQFFVTLSPQPHLDGRYTAFGEVTAGQTVVDALLEGDKILEVRATP